MNAAGTYVANVLERGHDLTHGDRSALLALAVLTDQDLDSRNGYDYVHAGRVAKLLGLTQSVVDTRLRSLTRRHFIDAVVRATPPGPQPSGTTSRLTVTGESMLQYPSRSYTALGYRIPEHAFRGEPGPMIGASP